MIAIYNGQVITEDNVFYGGLLIDGGKIHGVFKGDLPVGIPLTLQIDAEGRYISPGFVDIHIHGGGGREVNEAEPEAIKTLCGAHARHGTTSVLPTVMAAPPEQMKQAVLAIRTAAQTNTGAHILGAHLEGPYFAKSQRGAQSADCIKDPDPAEYMPLLDTWDGIKMMGVACELPGALALGDELRRRGIAASIAHSDAEYSQIAEAMNHGFSDVTHIYSGCSGVFRKNAYRYAGVIESGLLLDGLTVQVIADGKHLPPTLLKLIYKCKGPDKISLITDALSFAGTPLEEGKNYRQKNGVSVVYEDGVMKLSDRQAFAGSVAVMADLVRNMTTLGEVPLHEAVTMASKTPAAVVGAKAKGRLAPGCDADVILFDKNIQVSCVMIQGVLVGEEQNIPDCAKGWL